jgi:ELWxxDGT repeat protein
MWTDEQLAAQGWTNEQIATYRAEEASQVVNAVTDGVIPEAINGEVALPETASPVLQETFEARIKGDIPNINSTSISAILLVAMLVLVPFSLYSISNAEGTQGPPGEIGTAGTNGSDGSSFHLVPSLDGLPACDTSLNNQIFFIAADAGFQVCQNNVWTEIDLTGQSGLNGTDGASGQNGTDGQDGANGQNGADGQDGADGQNGADGQDGANGQTSLMSTSFEAPGANCPTGGTRVVTGIDDNGNNALSTDEIDDTIFICNGENGNDGANGADGLDGADGVDGTNGSSTTTMMVARLSVAPAYLGCGGVGQLLQQGLDDGSGNGIAQNGILESGEIISSSLICTTFVVNQVEDLNPGATGSNPADFVTINSTLYFTANNGTANGIWSMNASGNISLEYSGSALGLRAIGSQLMFSGQGLSLDVEPYVYDISNGTAWQIADIFPGASGSFAGEFTLIGTTVFFSARDSAGVYDLWAYDTVNFTVWKQVANIQPTGLIAVNSDLYFSAGPNNGNVELWKHETATNATFMVKDINPGLLSSSPQHLALMGTTIYMSANAGTTYGTELYAYETTNNSTWLAADIRPGFAGSSPSELVILGTRIYLQATSGSFFEMWAYETTNNSFWEVTNIQSTSGLGGPTELTVRGYTVFFAADDGTTGEELWAHHSINETTWQVIDLNPGSGGLIYKVHAHEGNVYFSGDDGVEGIELWRLIFSRTVSFV